LLKPKAKKRIALLLDQKKCSINKTIIGHRIISKGVSDVEGSYKNNWDY
jgi:hypothetical protein